MKPGFAALVLLLVPGAWGSSVTAAVPEPAPEQVLDEVLVKGERARLEDLRAQMIEAEARFFERYNELNDNDAFDVNCRSEARTGTRIKRRYCRAEYEEEAIRQQGQESLLNLQYIRSQLPTRGDIIVPGPPLPATIVMEARRPEFRENMRRVVSESAELFDLLLQREDMVDRYELLRRQVFGLDDPEWEESEDP